VKTIAFGNVKTIAFGNVKTIAFGNVKTVKKFASGSRYFSKGPLDP
jgi:hypothetical protein